jgi:hypothetical protein
MKEIWRDIPNYEGLYQVSNLGRVKVLDRDVNSGIKNNINVKRKGKILKQYVKNGYLQVTLTVNNKRKYINVHRLVAQAFIPNPNNLPQVNHKDENKQNNYVENLEWCSAKYNCNYGSRNKRIYNVTSFKKIGVNVYDKNYILIKTFGSISEAMKETHHSYKTIINFCKDINKDQDFIWRYAEK